VFISLSFH